MHESILLFDKETEGLGSNFHLRKIFSSAARSFTLGCYTWISYLVFEIEMSYKRLKKAIVVRENLYSNRATWMFEALPCMDAC